jgi:hypothetical protein
LWACAPAELGYSLLEYRGHGGEVARLGAAADDPPVVLLDLSDGLVEVLVSRDLLLGVAGGRLRAWLVSSPPLGWDGERCEAVVQVVAAVRRATRW